MDDTAEEVGSKGNKEEVEEDGDEEMGEEELHEQEEITTRVQTLGRSNAVKERGFV